MEVSELYVDIAAEKTLQLFQTEPGAPGRKGEFTLEAVEIFLKSDHGRQLSEFS
jgi:hypothetical protein